MFELWKNKDNQHIYLVIRYHLDDSDEIRQKQTQNSAKFDGIRSTKKMKNKCGQEKRVRENAYWMQSLDKTGTVWFIKVILKTASGPFWAWPIWEHIRSKYCNAYSLDCDSIYVTELILLHFIKHVFKPALQATDGGGKRNGRRKAKERVPSWWKFIC